MTDGLGGNQKYVSPPFLVETALRELSVILGSVQAIHGRVAKSDAHSKRADQSLTRRSQYANGNFPENW
ncbi:MAG: hypothetical protein OXE94_15590 [Aestuariivita sp.]|nr:hypothetical protein [Aestuariivita sp.]MCY4201396.1 hypothetical protein [Aestuariivita sp.]MCY4290051.1 hypothetical protein [Aestuariivita sp.]MCY4346836.1 hypothetical protein [Aestuariivita sp.]